jgi:hypothetical protein
MFGIVAPLTRRVHIYEFNAGSDATPADQAQKFSWQRGTANFATPAAVTPVSLDPSDGVSTSLFSAPGGAAPTLTANAFVLQWAQNARANFRWIAAPDSELVVPQSVTNQTTTCNALYLMNLVSTATQNWAWSVLWAE